MTNINLSATLCFLGVVQAATGTWAGACKSQSRTEAGVDHWPVNAAIKTPDVPGASFNITLSQSRVPVVNLSFTYHSSYNEVVMMEMKIRFQQSPASTFLIFFASDTWNTAVLNWQRETSKLVFSVSAPVGVVNYSIKSAFDVDLSKVDHVAATCIKTCVVDVDLECLAGSPATEVNRLNPTGSHTHEAETSTVAWAIVVLFVFMLVAVVLFLAWRHQHKKVKIQAHDVASRKRNTESVISTGSDSTQISAAQPRLQYSTILLSYDGPYSGSDEESSQGAACGGALPKTINNYHRGAQACLL